MTLIIKRGTITVKLLIRKIRYLLLGRMIFLKKESLLKLSDVSNYAALDYLKFFCAILVVVIHINPFNIFGSAIGFYTVNTLPRIAVPVFFMISGYFLFSKLDNREKIKQYSIKVIRLYAVYTLIYLPLIKAELSSRSDQLVFLRKLLLFRSFVHLWYLLTLFFSVLIISLLYNKLKISLKSQLIMFGVLHIIGILISFYRPVFENTFLKSIIDDYYKYFFDIENCVFFGFYVVLGCFIREQHDRIKQKKYGFYAVISFCAFLCETIIGREILGSSNCQISFFLVPTVLCVFLSGCFFSMPYRLRSHSMFFRKQSSILYLWHYFFYYTVACALVFKITGKWINNFFAFIIVIVVSFVFGTIWIKLSKHKLFKFLNYIS